MIELVEKDISPLMGRIYEAQKKLKTFHPDHNLLNLVSVDDIGIYWKKEFEALYPRINNDYDRLSQYASELENLLSLMI